MNHGQKYQQTLRPSIGQFLFKAHLDHGASWPMHFAELGQLIRELTLKLRLHVESQLG